jgi:putative transposase
VRAPPGAAGRAAADWTWKAGRAFCRRRFGVALGRRSCLTSLHRLGFVVKRPKKRLLKADAAERAAFVAEYAALRRAAHATGTKHLVVDEAHFSADADLRGTWVLKGEPALVDATSPRWGEKASYYGAVCVETGEVTAMPLVGNSSAETSAAFLRHVRARPAEPLVIFWDNAPAHSGDALRASLTSPGLRRRLARLPAYSPDVNAAEAIWDWARDEVTANTCFGPAARVRAHLDPFFAGLAARPQEVKRRCRTVLQAKADALDASVAATDLLQHTTHVDPSLALD